MVRIEKIIENKNDDDLKSVCVVVPLDSETCELKNIATYEKYRSNFGKDPMIFFKTQSEQQKGKTAILIKNYGARNC
jgi:hypothetical protein